jgi:hypothetical protein
VVQRHPALTSEFGWVPEMKVRQFFRSASRGRVGKFSSQKMLRNVRARSDLEFDLMRWLEIDPEIDWYVEQPIMVRYRLGNANRRHIPDALYRRRDGTRGFIEVKYEEMASRTEMEAKYEAIGLAASESGFKYELLTERHIRREPRFSTIKTLFLRNRQVGLPDQKRQLDLANVIGERVVPLEEASALLPDVTEAHIKALVLRGFLTIDFEEPLTAHSLVRVTGRPPVRKRVLLA